MATAARRGKEGMSVAESASSIPDPLAAWRAWLGQSEQQWNAFLNQAMGTDQYSQSVGRFMEFYATLQKNLTESMGRSLAALNMPTRADILALGDRLAMIEDRLAEIERALGRVAGAGTGGGGEAAPVPRPPRTKQPAPHPAPGGAPATGARP